MILESKRIRLRFFDKYDKNDLIILLNDEDVSKWMDNVPYPYLEKHADWWIEIGSKKKYQFAICLLYTSPSPRDVRSSRMPSSA